MHYAVAVIGTLLSLGTEVEDKGFSVEASLGQSTFPNINSSALGNGKIKDTAYSIALSYHFSSWFALKAGYVDLGKARYESRLDSALPGYEGPNGHLDWSAEAYTLAVVPSIPLNDQIKVFAELGWQSDELRLTSVFPELEEGEFVSFGRESTKRSGDDTYFGLGLSYAINDKLSTKLAYKEFKFQEEDIRFVDLGLQWRF